MDIKYKLNVGIINNFNLILFEECFSLPKWQQKIDAKATPPSVVLITPVQPMTGFPYAVKIQLNKLKKKKYSFS